jgi:hypothetical protein
MEPPLAAPTSQTGRPIIYFPALVKIKDEYRCELSQPIMVSEPVVDRSFLTIFDRLHWLRTWSVSGNKDRKGM